MTYVTNVTAMKRTNAQRSRRMRYRNTVVAEISVFWSPCQWGESCRSPPTGLASFVSCCSAPYRVQIWVRRVLWIDV